MIWVGLQPGEPELVPTPSGSFSVSAPTSVPTAGPGSSVTVDGTVVSPATMGACRVLIPSLGVYARYEDRGFSGGEFDLPGDSYTLARNKGGGSVAGDAGTVLVSGHVTWSGSHGSMYSLATIAPNAVVYVSSCGGPQVVTTWVVTSMESVRKSELPQWLFASSGPRRGALVTCGGTPTLVHDGGRQYFVYPDNTIVGLAQVRP